MAVVPAAEERALPGDDDDDAPVDPPLLWLLGLKPHTLRFSSDRLKSISEPRVRDLIGRPLQTPPPEPLPPLSPEVGMLSSVARETTKLKN